MRNRNTLCYCAALFLLGFLLSVSCQDITLLRSQLHDLTHLQQPAEVVFLIDGSGSIAEHDFAQQLKTVGSIVGKLPATASVAVVIFSDTATQVFGMTKLTEYNRNRLISTIQSVNQPKGGTETKRGFEMAASCFSSSNDKKYIILLTDGQPTDQPEQYVRELKNRVTILGLGFGTVHEAKLRELSTFSLRGQNLSDVINFIEGAIGVPALEGIVVDFPVKGNERFGISEDITLQTTIKNRGITPLPAGTIMDFNEISKDLSKPYFQSTKIEIPEILPKEQYTASFTLSHTGYAYITRVPEQIGWSLKLNSLPMMEGNITLYSHMFARELEAEISQLYRDLRLLLVGPAGNGKSFVTNAIATALSDSMGRNTDLASWCTGDSHCTQETGTYRILRNLFVRDTIGLGGDNYSEEFLRYLVDGRIPDKWNSTDIPNELQLLPKHPYGVVILVIAPGIAKADQDYDQVKQLKQAVEVLKQMNVKHFGIVTFWETLKTEEDREKTLENISALLSIPPANLFPFSGYPCVRERVFETDMQVLDILNKAVKLAKAQEANEPKRCIFGFWC